MFRTERIFILTILLLVGLGLSLAVSRGALSADAAQGGVLLWLVGGTLVLLAAVGSRWARRGALAAVTGSVPDEALPLVPVPLDAIVPGAMAAAFVMFLQFFESGIMQALIVGVGGLAFAGLFWAQSHALESNDRYFALAHSLLNVISHLTAFLFFSVVYGLKVRALFSATAVGLVCSLLIYEMLARDASWHVATSWAVRRSRASIVVLSIVSGLVLAEVMWGLSYWAALTTLVGGAFLLVIFYVVSGLTSHYVDSTITRPVVIEFAAVGVLGVLVVLASAFFT